MIRALIVDDEEPGRLNLRLALAEHAGWQVAGEAANGPAALALLEGTAVDVVFLDIRMPGQTGLQLAAQIASRPDAPLIVFVTAYDAHAVDAFDLQALDYLLKPFDDQRIARTLERVAATLGERAGYARAVQAAADASDSYLTQLNVRSVGRIEFVRVSDIRWIEAAGNYVHLHLAGRSVMHRVTLAQLERRLDPAHFMRVHRGAFVRMGECFRLEMPGDGKLALRLRGGELVNVSARHAAAVRARLDP
ncbi:MAG TPA: response regulator transcription factor [Telluria sp.]|nr:response regulator transcription factor [Telluria sp.]